MSEKKSNSITINKLDLIEIIIIIAVVVGVIITIIINKIENAPYDNTGKHYTETVYKTWGDCDEVIFGTIQEYGDDYGYYCYEVTDTYGKKVWKMGNINDK